MTHSIVIGVASSIRKRKLVIDIFILVLLVLIAAALGYLVYILRNLVIAQHIEITTQTALKDSEYERNTRLYSENIQFHQIMNQGIEDRVLLIELMQMLWEARDTEAAARWVKNLITPSMDGKHYTVKECYDGFREDLGFSKVPE